MSMAMNNKRKRTAGNMLGWDGEHGRQRKNGDMKGCRGKGYDDWLGMKVWYCDGKDG